MESGYVVSQSNENKKTFCGNVSVHYSNITCSSDNLSRRTIPCPNNALLISSYASFPIKVRKSSGVPYVLCTSNV